MTSKRGLSAESLTDDGGINLPDRGRTTALVTGSVALGAVITGALLRMMHHANLHTSGRVPPALEAPVEEMEMMEGAARFYHRDGSGIPIVLLHSINAAASSHEMKPVFDHYATTTSRPIYAMDWLGFGQSDRPSVRYTPDLYQRQLRRFLSEYVHQPADIVALSLGCEFAVTVAHALPYLVHHLVCLSPTGLERDKRVSPLRQTAIRLAGGIGAFELIYYRLTRRDSLRRFYEKQVFGPGEDVPNNLVEYADVTSHVHGAHHAPRFFVAGSLSTGDSAVHAYTHVRIPTLLVAPEVADGLVQQFDRMDEVLEQNRSFLQQFRISRSLLPQWTETEAVMARLDAFLDDAM